MSFLGLGIVQLISMTKKTTVNRSRLSFLSPLRLCFLLSLAYCPSINSSSPNVSLNCGTTGSLSFNGVNWVGDVGSELIPAVSARTTVTAVSKPAQNVPSTPYLTARVFLLPFVYSFPASPGVKFIRLHFYPISYSGFGRISKAYFSVTAGRYTLLDSFSPSGMADILKSAYFTKEFVIDVKENVLNLTFIPSINVPEAFAFVNGIEILSMTMGLWNYAGNATSSPFSDQDEPALEMLYRVNIAGKVENPLWTTDTHSNYILGSKSGTEINTSENISYNSWTPSEYGAPADLYSTARTMDSDDDVNLKYNLTWAFYVDSGFKYLVRLHFCEISFEVTGVNQRVFNVYINNETVEKNLDLVALAGKPLVAIYRDYFVEVPEGKGGWHDLKVALHPSTEAKPNFADAVLNGIEIIKLSNSSGNLAAHMQVSNEKRKKIHSSIMISAVLGGLALLIVLFCILYRWVSVKLPRFCPRSPMTTPVLMSAGTCRKFTLAEIRAATKNFNDALVIGVGGFGKVYKGLMNDGFTKVAVKRGNPKSQQGVKEFQNEIELLSKFCHKNLVALLGFCQEDKELILVYDYIARGTLREHLYNTQNTPLSWNKRLQMCIGAAQGLHYLHTSTKHPIVHRDIKSTNILLDHDWVAKVSDFGLSKIVPTRTSQGHVSTEVKGTFGYLDPRYYRSRRLTEKSDVYSFGVVLFEVLCARPAVSPTVKKEDEKISLAEWALICYQNDTIQDMMDPYLRGKIASESLTAFVNIAIKCLAERRTDRPSMGDVLANLEIASRLQKAEDARTGMEDEVLMIIESIAG